MERWVRSSPVQTLGPKLKSQGSYITSGVTASTSLAPRIYSVEWEQGESWKSIAAILSFKPMERLSLRRIGWRVIIENLFWPLQHHPHLCMHIPHHTTHTQTHKQEQAKGNKQESNSMNFTKCLQISNEYL